MHYVYIICIGFLLSITIPALIPPYTVAQHEYRRKYCTQKQIEIHDGIIWFALLFPSFKIAIILVNYLEW